jgi:hypothetical protein
MGILHKMMKHSASFLKGILEGKRCSVIHKKYCRN